MQPLYRPRRGRRNDGGKPETVTPPALRDVRAELPCLAATTYLNSGAIGPLALPAGRALQAWAAGAPARARGSLEGFGRIAAQAAAVRAAAGRLVGAAPGTVALTANTTHGLNVVAWGIDWRPGDEIVTTALEHPGVTVPLAVVARRTGARLQVVEAARPGRPRGGGRPDRRSADPPRGPLARLLVHRAALDVAGAARAAPRRRRPDRRGRRPVGGHDPGRRGGARRRRVRLPRPQVAARARGRRRALGQAGGHGADRRHRGGARERRGRRGARGVRRHGAHPRRAATRPRRRRPLLAAWEASMEWLEGLGWPWIHARSARPRPPRGRPSSGCRAWRC